MKEAIKYTEQSIQEAQRRGDSELHLIVGALLPVPCTLTVQLKLASSGKGLHSKNGAAKIKPAIEDLMQKCVSYLSVMIMIKLEVDCLLNEHIV